MEAALAQRTDRLLSDLSEPQRKAVLTTDGPLLVLAGPGSGKTRVITRRAAYLARTVTSPRHVLAITFTNKAAREMRERIEALDVDPDLTVSTFHALCARLLREFHDAAGVPRYFTIVDRDDRRKLIKQAVERCDLSPANWPATKVEAVISRAKNAMHSAEELGAGNDWSLRTIARIFAVYESLLAEMGGLDFDDLLLRMARLLEGNGTTRTRLQDRYRYVLVDEYQDTNAAQYRITRLLTERDRNVCATGDPDQSIYGWRGANIENILSFEHDFPDARVIRLEENYRSTQRILSAADALIAGNVRRKIKSLWTRNDEGCRVRVMECETNEDEAKAVVADIAAQMQSGTAPAEIAVLYRVNALSRGVEDALWRAGIAYQVVRGVEFYNRKEIKDVLAYLRVLVNPADEVSLLRIINMPPRGIGDTTVERLVAHAQKTGRKVHDVISDAQGLSFLGRSAAKVREFADLLAALGPALERPAPQAIQTVVSRSGLRAHYGQVSDAEGSAVENIDELINAAAQFARERPEATLVDWLEYTALVSDIDLMRDEGGAVTLMTLHAAKGLEFSGVYIIGLEDDLLPLRRGDDGFDEEEERRLCFVGMTRAKHRLTLLHSRYRMLRGASRRTVRSPFLDELPAEQIEWICTDAVTERSNGHETSGFRRTPDEFEEWGVGSLVRHPLFGLGRIVNLWRDGRGTHVDVGFPNGSVRQWILEFSELEGVDYHELG